MYGKIVLWGNAVDKIRHNLPWAAESDKAKTEDQYGEQKPLWGKIKTEWNR